MKTLRQTNLRLDQIVSMITHTQRRALRLMQLRAAGDNRPKLLLAIERACGIVSMWHAIYDREASRILQVETGRPI